MTLPRKPRSTSASVAPAHAAAAPGDALGELTADRETGARPASEASRRRTVRGPDRRSEGDASRALFAAADLLEEMVLVLEPGRPGEAPHVVYANAAVWRMIDPRDPQPPTVTSYAPDRTHPALMALRDAVQSGLDTSTVSHWDLEFTLPARSGASNVPDARTLMLRATASPVRESLEGAVRHWSVVLRDMSAHWALADRSTQAERLASLGLLAGSVAHDFNNLVHVISGFSELALTQIPSDGPAVAHIRQVQDAARRAASLARQLLAFSRRQPIKPVRVDLHTIVEDLRGVLVRLAGNRVAVHIAPRLAPAMVCADPTSLEQIVLNLVVNAREAQPSGGRVELAVDVVAREALPVDASTLTDDATHWVRLKVQDAGPGMPVEIQSRVFEPFFTTKSTGTGLGLSTVLRIVRDYEGLIHLSSPEGEGLCVEVYLPEVPAQLTRMTARTP